MKLSIAIPVYQSHEIVRRQCRHWARLRLPADVEIILVDDGSEPPLTAVGVANLRILTTGQRLAWTQGLARNLGAEAATGEYLLLTDIDHILSAAAIADARAFTGSRMMFRRQIALLDADGHVTQEPAALRAWGYERASLDASVHGNTFVLPRADFWALGGYTPETCLRGYHPKSRQGDDCYFNAKWNHAHRGEQPVMGSDIYLFPLGRFHKDGDLNPFGLFHGLHQREERAIKGEERNG